jgi:hypothetical protein
MENIIVEETNDSITTQPLAASNAASKKELNKVITDLGLKLTILQTSINNNEAGTDFKAHSLSNSIYALQEQLDKTRRMFTVLSIVTSIVAALVVNLYFN